MDFTFSIEDSAVVSLEVILAVSGVAIICTVVILFGLVIVCACAIRRAKCETTYNSI